MAITTNDTNTVLVKTEGAVTRGSQMTRPVDAIELANNINAFIAQMDGIMQDTLETVGKFTFKKFTVSAEITAEGKLAHPRLRYHHQPHRRPHPVVIINRM